MKLTQTGSLEPLSNFSYLQIEVCHYLSAVVACMVSWIYPPPSHLNVDVKKSTTKVNMFSRKSSTAPFHQLCYVNMNSANQATKFFPHSNEFPTIQERKSAVINNWAENKLWKTRFFAYSLK